MQRDSFDSIILKKFCSVAKFKLDTLSQKEIYTERWLYLNIYAIDLYIPSKNTSI